MVARNDSVGGFEEMFSVEEQAFLKRAIARCEENIWIFGESRNAEDVARQAKVLGLKVEI